MRIYLAGKIAGADWRAGIVSGLGSITGDMVEYGERREATLPAEPPVLRNAVLDEHDYVGPYYVAGNHDGLIADHGLESRGEHGYWRPEEVTRFCMQGVAACDMLFAWLTTSDCHGTLVEIGYAVGMKKVVIVAAPDRDSIAETWFAAQAACEVIISPTPVKALREAVEVETPTRLRWLAQANYSAYLQTKHWKAIRARKLHQAGYRCQVCNSPDSLNTHHRTYDNLGREEDGDLTVLCRPCHARHHNVEEVPAKQQRRKS